jgi:hypothetical protein
VLLLPAIPTLLHTVRYSTPTLPHIYAPPYLRSSAPTLHAHPMPSHHRQRRQQGRDRTAAMAPWAGGERARLDGNGGWRSVAGRKRAKKGWRREMRLERRGRGFATVSRRVSAGSGWALVRVFRWRGDSNLGSLAWNVLRRAAVVDATRRWSRR